MSGARVTWRPITPVKLAVCIVASAIAQRLRPTPSTAQSDTGLVAIDEFNARRFKRAPNSSQIIDRRDPPAFFKVADSALAQVRPSSQFRL
jgi:hypothetical protein